MTSEQTSDFGDTMISTSGLAGRYALALFDLAKDAGELDVVAGELGALGGLLADGGDLKDLTTSPIFSREEQTRAMTAVVAHAKFSKLVANFIGVVGNNRRLDQLGAIINEFDRLLAHHKGEVSASVITAHQLTKDQLDGLKTKLKSMVGSDVNVETEIDESLLGGMVVKIGSRMIDSSLKTKLANLEESMKEVG